MENRAAWLLGVGKNIQIGAADIPVPGEGELVIETKAVAVQPAEYKIQKGILSFPLTYPTIIGLSASGVVYNVGPGVTRFKRGDRIVTNTAGTLRNDSRFGAYQKYALTTQSLTAKISDVPFEAASSTSNLYGAISALTLHLGLSRPSAQPNPALRTEKVLIWGASSSFGQFAVQIAASAGYTVVSTASSHNYSLVTSLGASHFVDRNSPSTAAELIALGPYKAVLAAADAAADQLVIGAVLAAQGGGTFLTTMGVRPGVVLPDGVKGLFVQYLDDYLDPQNREFTEWVWWEYLEEMLRTGSIVLPKVEVIGGLSKLQEAWDLLHEEKVSGKRLVIRPDVD